MRQNYEWQIDPSRVICNLCKGTPSELEVAKIIKHQCTLESARLDVACMSPCGRLVLSVQETKEAASETETEISREDIQQLAAYMIAAVAFSQWGVGQKKNDEPIVGLLVFPARICRLSLWKPMDSSRYPFGLMHSIEVTSDPLMMGWVLEVFLRKYKADYDRLVNLSLNFQNVNPVLWTSLNCQIGMPLRDASETNLGFLFRSNSATLASLIEQTPRADLEQRFCVALDKIPSQDTLIVKYLSALLTVSPATLISPIESLIKAEITSETVAQRDETTAAENARLRARLEQLEGKVSSMPGPTPLLEKTDAGNRLKIKHPYVGVLKFDQRHPLIVMRDVGNSMIEEIEDHDLRARWRSNSGLRQNFAKDVGESALNMIEDSSLMLCHNDIWPANIAVNGDSFCLIDFDMSTKVVSPITARVLQHLRSKYTSDASMLFTIAQIALVVFELDSDATPLEVSDVRKYWLADNPFCRKSKLDKFELWVKRKGKLVEEVFTDVPPARLPESRDDFMRIIHALLL